MVKQLIKISFCMTLMLSLVSSAFAQNTNDTSSAKVKALNDVVVVGYGTVKKKDLTGSVISIKSKDFLQGNVTSAEQLINGKVAGAQITTEGGAPGAGSRIRIRGNASIAGSNDPLIVIDGTPVTDMGVAGSANPLSMINPNDIESIDVLKDASATAIYGVRAANGVIIITTKRGKNSENVQVTFSSVTSLSYNPKQLDMLNSNDFKALVKSSGNQNWIKLLDTVHTTNWQSQVFRTALATDNNLSITGGKTLYPYRFSIGNLSQQGILKTGSLNRTSLAFNVTPMFWDNHLKVDVNFKASATGTQFANEGAIGSAVTFDPTKPINSYGGTWGGYYEWLNQSGNPIPIAPRNPVGLLNQKNDLSNTYRTMGNVMFDYKTHFLPALRMVMNFAYDNQSSNGSVFIPASAATNYTTGGYSSKYEGMSKNKLFDFYLNYVKDFGAANLNVTAGYSWQDFYSQTSNNPSYSAKGVLIPNTGGLVTPSFPNIQSYFGRLNFNIKGKYYLTATMRRDGSSKMPEANRWALFPSAALAWRVSEEGFLKNSNAISNLKVRLGWGQTGNPSLPVDFIYLAKYTPGANSAAYQFGNTFINTLRPEGYNADIKWETQTTQNVGVDFGFANNRINGSVDIYNKKTENLINYIPLAAGTNLTNYMWSNVGNMENKGFEIMLNAQIINKPNFTWDFGVTFAQNKNTITKLLQVQDSNYLGVAGGGIAGGVGNTIQMNSVGNSINSFYTYQQVYDANGKPIEGLYVDKNGDGVVDAKDKTLNKSSEPTQILGFTNNIRYKKWTLNMTLRANMGQYIYNNNASNLGTMQNIYNSAGYLNNVHSSVLTTNFQAPQYWSNYYIENGSFLRMDNINLGYNVGSIFNKKASLRLSAIVQNAFVITKYSGIDPEVSSGIDNNKYPRPRIFSLGANLQF